MFKKLLDKLEPEELTDLSKFFIDIAKGLMGAPLVVYLVTGFSNLVLFMMFVLDLILVFGCWIIAIKLSRESRRRRKNGY